MMTQETAVTIAAWLGALAFMVGLANGLIKLFSHLKDKPPAHEVAKESAEKYVAKAEFRDHVLRNDQEHDNFFKKLGGVERGLTRELQEMERRLNAKDEERTHGLHNRVNEILGEMREIRGEMNAKQKTIARA